MRKPRSTQAGSRASTRWRDEWATNGPGSGRGRGGHAGGPVRLESEAGHPPDHLPQRRDDGVEIVDRNARPLLAEADDLEADKLEADDLEADGSGSVHLGAARRPSCAAGWGQEELDELDELDRIGRPDVLDIVRAAWPQQADGLGGAVVARLGGAVVARLGATTAPQRADGLRPPVRGMVPTRHDVKGFVRERQSRRIGDDDHGEDHPPPPLSPLPPLPPPVDAGAWSTSQGSAGTTPSARLAAASRVT
ncbi:hypothetical protein [Pseudoclavibacter sp. AY1F1]|uniref:hypothetical protein n=1 Tax=Pseudoclavibacter sp. AY1F1 TaxID=2080583 RepID=UPI0015E3E740|nr:hypothetical protein [Pseudoclavibacter sp. AY1F1]